MSKLYKVAEMFQRKLSFAATNNLQNFTSVYQAIKTLGQTKDLWITSDPVMRHVIDSIVDEGKRTYYRLTTQGLGAKGAGSYADFLNSINNKIQAFAAREPYKNLDPNASQALDGLKKALEAARSNFIPVGIPALKPEVRLPQDTIHANPPPEVTPAGAAYHAPVGADPDALTNVVQNLVEQHNPTGPAAWTKRDWDALQNSQ